MLEGIESKTERRIAAGEFLRNLSWNNSQLAFDILDDVDDTTIRRQHPSHVSGCLDLPGIAQRAGWETERARKNPDFGSGS